MVKSFKQMMFSQNAIVNPTAANISQNAIKEIIGDESNKPKINDSRPISNAGKA